MLELKLKIKVEESTYLIRLTIAAMISKVNTGD